MIRVVLPYHLRNLARVGAEVQLDVPGTTTVSSVLDELETTYPVLRGTIRDHSTKARRAYLRYFACGKDISFVDTSDELPEAIAGGEEPFMIIGAIAGG